MGLGLCPPLANADPLHAKSNAAVTTEQPFAPNIIVSTQPTARTKSSREKLTNCYFALASVYVSAHGGLLLSYRYRR